MSHRSVEIVEKCHEVQRQYMESVSTIQEVEKNLSTHAESSMWQEGLAAAKHDTKKVEQDLRDLYNSEAAQCSETLIQLRSRARESRMTKQWLDSEVTMLTLKIQSSEQRLGAAVQGSHDVESALCILDDPALDDIVDELAELGATLDRLDSEQEVAKWELSEDQTRRQQVAAQMDELKKEQTELTKHLSSLEEVLKRNRPPSSIWGSTGKDQNGDFVDDIERAGTATLSQAMTDASELMNQLHAAEEDERLCSLGLNQINCGIEALNDRLKATESIAAMPADVAAAIAEEANRDRASLDRKAAEAKQASLDAEVNSVAEDILGHVTTAHKLSMKWMDLQHEVRQITATLSWNSRRRHLYQVAVLELHDGDPSTDQSHLLAEAESAAETEVRTIETTLGHIAERQEQMDNELHQILESMQSIETSMLQAQKEKQQAISKLTKLQETLVTSVEQRLMEDLEAEEVINKELAIAEQEFSVVQLAFDIAKQCQDALTKSKKEADHNVRNADSEVFAEQWLREEASTDATAAQSAAQAHAKDIAIQLQSATANTQLRWDELQIKTKPIMEVRERMANARAKVRQSQLDLILANEQVAAHTWKIRTAEWEISRAREELKGLRTQSRATREERQATRRLVRKLEIELPPAEERRLRLYKQRNDVAVRKRFLADSIQSVKDQVPILEKKRADCESQLSEVEKKLLEEKTHIQQRVQEQRSLQLLRREHAGRVTGLHVQRMMTNKIADVETELSELENQKKDAQVMRENCQQKINSAQQEAASLRIKLAESEKNIDKILSKIKAQASTENESEANDPSSTLGSYSLDSNGGGSDHQQLNRISVKSGTVTSNGAAANDSNSEESAADAATHAEIVKVRSEQVRMELQDLWTYHQQLDNDCKHLEATITKLQNTRDKLQAYTSKREHWDIHGAVMHGRIREWRRRSSTQLLHNNVIPAAPQALNDNMPKDSTHDANHAKHHQRAATLAAQRALEDQRSQLPMVRAQRVRALLSAEMMELSSWEVSGMRRKLSGLALGLELDKALHKT